MFNFLLILMYKSICQEKNEKIINTTNRNNNNNKIY